MKILSLAQTKEMLEQSQNPFFLYDNDADGFCSMVLLRRWLERGSSEIVRSNPQVEERYAHTALDHKADLVVVLDRHSLSASFVALLDAANVPVLWIDHHVVEVPAFSDNVWYHNPHTLHLSPAPVTALCYRITKRKDDMWIAMMGCVADHYLPSFKTTFAQRYKGFWGRVKKPFDAYFDTEIGALAQAIGFGIKGHLGAVREIESFFIACTSPENAQSELASESDFATTCRTLLKRYKELYKEASHHTGKLIFFRYAGQTSMSAALANELSHRHPRSVIVVAYAHGLSANLSIRGKGVLSVLNNILPAFPGASGGGHRDAVGARMKTSYLDDFKAKLEVAL